MKKAYISALSSAFVIPGLGQILNKQLKKGLIILAAIFILMITNLITSYQLIKTVLEGVDTDSLDPQSLLAIILNAECASIKFIFFITCILWLYSVFDAFLWGHKIEQQGTHNSQ